MGRTIVAWQQQVELVVRAKLLDYQQYRDCQLGNHDHYGVVMKYELTEIVEIIGGSPKDFPYTLGDTLYIVHGVPEIPRREYHQNGGMLNHFHTLDKHEMRIKKKIENNLSPFVSIFDPYQSSKENRYLCIKVDLAEYDFFSL